MHYDFHTMAVAATTGLVIVIDLMLAGFIGEVMRRSGASRSLIRTMRFIALAVMAILIVGITTRHLFPEHMSGGLFFALLLGWLGIVSATFVFVRPLRESLLNAPQSLLLMPQGLRVFLGAGFLVQSSLGLMPQYFGIIDGLTHVTAGFLALKTGLLIAQGGRERFELWFANLFGLMDIVFVATGLSFFLLDDLTPYHGMMYAAFFAAPLFVVLHIMSLWKALRERTSANESSIEGALHHA